MFLPINLHIVNVTSFILFLYTSLFKVLLFLVPQLFLILPVRDLFPFDGISKSLIVFSLELKLHLAGHLLHLEQKPFLIVKLFSGLMALTQVCCLLLEELFYKLRFAVDERYLLLNEE